MNANESNFGSSAAAVTAPPTLNFGLNIAAPQKRGAIHMGELGGFDKRRFPLQPPQMQVHPQAPFTHNNSKRPHPGVPLGNLIKRGRFFQEPLHEVENMKRNASCLNSNLNNSLYARDTTMEKRARQGENYHMKMDPFVEEHIQQREAAFSAQIASLKEEMSRMSEKCKSAMNENRTLKSVVPILNKKYEEEVRKVSDLRQMVAKYASELEKVQIKVRLESYFTVYYMYFSKNSKMQRICVFVVLVCMFLASTKRKPLQNSSATYATWVMHRHKQFFSI